MVEAVRAVPGHEVVLVAGRNRQRLDTWCNQHTVHESTEDFDECCRSSNVDAIYVALPPSLHDHYVSLGLAAGKVVLCEKPLVVNLHQLQSIQNGLDYFNGKAPLYHATAFPFHPRSIAMRDVIRNGELGEIRRITIACSFSHILNRGPDHRTDSRLGGGCLLDLGWYCIFATLWFTGLRPVEWMATGTRLPDNSDGSNGAWLEAQALVRLSNGAVAHWDCGYDAAGRKWMEIAGSKASLICDDFLRPWDTEKPRFWVHGSDGKARSELVGCNVFQEREMIAGCSPSPTPESLESLGLAIETQQLLNKWESQIR